MSDSDTGERVRVADATKFEPGDRTVIDLDGTAVGVLNIDGEYYAIENTCNHRGGPVCKGRVQGQLVGEYKGPSRRVEENFADDLAIACPWHGWEYDLETGVNLADESDESIALKTFDVIVEDGILYLQG